jgi:DNA primase
MSTNRKIADKIDMILDSLNVEYEESGKEIRMACPIHGGSDKNACIYISNDYEPNWKCYSHNCHENNYGLINLLMGILNKNFKETIEWLDKFDIKYEPLSKDRKISKTLNILTKQRRKTDFHIPISLLQQYSDNVEFYINRGFKPETLSKFNIKVCKNRKDYLFGHVVVPVFNDDGKSIAGLIARNPNPKCLICDRFHKENEPCSENGTKWKNTKGFTNNSFLYNIWNAKQSIETTKEVILVESAADVWRMYEGGIYNVLGMFGTSLSEDQKLILETLPILKINLFLDPDEPGKESAQRLKNYLDRFYNVKIIDYQKQPADCTPEELKTIFKKE